MDNAVEDGVKIAKYYEEERTKKIAERLDYLCTLMGDHVGLEGIRPTTPGAIRILINLTVKMYREERDDNKLTICDYYRETAGYKVRIFNAAERKVEVYQEIKEGVDKGEL